MLTDKKKESAVIQTDFTSLVSRAINGLHFWLKGETIIMSSNLAPFAFERVSPLQRTSWRKGKGIMRGLKVLSKTALILGLLVISGRTASAQCPAVGQSSTCGVVITVTNTGATVSFTGQPPYDGIEDQLVGVINNSSRPIRSLELKSSVGLFGFDGDGIDTYGIPGNALDSTGYGGPNAYFTNINSSLTAGTVNFIVPIAANGGTSFFSLEEAITSASECSSLINNGLSGPSLSGLSLSLGHTNISATFTPNFGLSLSEAAQVCGFTDFNWIQQVIHLPDPSPFYETNPSNPSAPIHLTSSSTPFNDPARNGYTYNPDWVSYPFYWDPNTTGLGWSLDRHKTTNTLSSFDAPNDPCISGPLGTPSIAWLFHPDIRALCGNSTTPRGSFLGFTTHLAGINSDGTGVDLGIGYSWTSNFNGTTGGIATTASYLPADSGSGEGGIAILSVQEMTDYGSIVVTTVNGGFDICLQDDSTRNTLRFNSTTGDYQFTKCGVGGFTRTGTGTVSIVGSSISLQQNGTDVRLLARIDNGAHKGSATLRILASGTILTITDRNTTNNSCSCP